MSSELVNEKTDIVISNVNNKSSSVEILNLVKKCFSNLVIKLHINHPFKGGFITSQLWKTRKNIHFIQIEVNKKLYMNEHNVLKKNCFQSLKIVLTI